MAAPKKSIDKKESAKSVMDVSKPGKTAATPTSRPVIVGHKSTLKQDPMVASNANSEEKPLSEEKSPKPTNMSHERVLEPPSEADTETGVPEDATAAESPSDPQSDNEPETSSTAAVDALANEVSAKREAEASDEKDTKRQAELEEIIQSRKYFVPIGEVSKRRMNHMILGLLFFSLLALVAVNFAIDAELLEIGVQPLTDLL